VNTTATTSFEIDGVTSTGSAGLTALSQQPAGTMTVAFGTLSTRDRSFTAEIVHAGDSVSGERIDAIHGNIVARRGNELTVKGGYAVRPNRIARLHRTIVVTVGPDTKVIKPGSDVALDAGALSVGQHIVAFGSLTEPVATTANATFDAARVRMLPTHLRGTVNSVVAGQLNMKLRAIDRLGVELFDFSGTGTTAATDADPADYEIATGTLGLASIAPNQAAKVLGFVRPFGGAPPDFEGRAVVDHRSLPAVLGIGWGMTGTLAPFSTMGNTGFVLDMTNTSIGARHHVLVGARLIDLTTLSVSPTIAPTTGRALYGISVGRDVKLFTSFAEFSTEVANRLSAGNEAIALVAVGSYEEGSATLTAHHIAMHFALN
jgi:hypothetical protein